MAEQEADQPKRRGFGGLLKGALDAFAPPVTDEEEDSTSKKSKRAEGGTTSTGSASAPGPRRTLNPTDVDPTFSEEVRTGIEERAPSAVLSTFLDQLRDLESDPDYREPRGRFKTALKITARAEGRSEEDALREIMATLDERVTAVTQERTIGLAELATAEQQQLTETEQRLTTIRTEVKDLRTRIGELQTEEAGLAERESGVKRQTAAARNKLETACDHWAAKLKDTAAKVQTHLKPPVAAKEE